jgi:uncharacterized protein (DUF2141 family)
MWFVASAQQTTCVLDCRFEGKRTGKLYIAAFDAESNWSKPEKAILSKVLEVKNMDKLSCALTELKAGTYAIAVFLDENDNGKIDTNWMGIPTEAYGYTNGARPKYREAQWSEVKFSLKQGENHVQTIAVSAWRF